MRGPAPLRPPGLSSRAVNDGMSVEEQTRRQRGKQHEDGDGEWSGSAQPGLSSPAVSDGMPVAVSDGYEDGKASGSSPPGFQVLLRCRYVHTRDCMPRCMPLPTSIRGPNRLLPQALQRHGAPIAGQHLQPVRAGGRPRCRKDIPV